MERTRPGTARCVSRPLSFAYVTRQSTSLPPMLFSCRQQHHPHFFFFIASYDRDTNTNGLAFMTIRRRCRREACPSFCIWRHHRAIHCRQYGELFGGYSQGLSMMGQINGPRRNSISVQNPQELPKAYWHTLWYRCVATIMALLGTKASRVGQKEH